MVMKVKMDDDVVDAGMKCSKTGTNDQSKDEEEGGRWNFLWCSNLVKC